MTKAYWINKASYACGEQHLLSLQPVQEHGAEAWFQPDRQHVKKI